MIEKLGRHIRIDKVADKEYEISCPPDDYEIVEKINEIIDHINNQQPKKPKSTNIALRQRIAEMETVLKHIIGISGAGLSAQERIADIREMAKCGLDPQYSPILVGRYTYPLKTEISVIQ